MPRCAACPEIARNWLKSARNPCLIHRAMPTRNLGIDKFRITRYIIIIATAADQTDRASGLIDWVVGRRRAEFLWTGTHGGRVPVARRSHRIGSLGCAP